MANLYEILAVEGNSYMYFNYKKEPSMTKPSTYRAVQRAVEILVRYLSQLF